MVSHQNPLILLVTVCTSFSCLCGNLWTNAQRFINNFVWKITRHVDNFVKIADSDQCSKHPYWSFVTTFVLQSSLYLGSFLVKTVGFLMFHLELWMIGENDQGDRIDQLNPKISNDSYLQEGKGQEQSI